MGVCLLVSTVARAKTLVPLIETGQVGDGGAVSRFLALFESGPGSSFVCSALAPLVGRSELEFGEWGRGLAFSRSLRERARVVLPSSAGRWLH